MSNENPENQRQINFRISDDEARIVRIMAAEHQQSVADFARDALVREVQQRLESGWEEKFSDKITKAVTRFKNESQ